MRCFVILLHCMAQETCSACCDTIKSMVESSPNRLVHERLDHIAPHTHVHQVAKKIVDPLQEVLQARMKAVSSHLLQKNSQAILTDPQLQERDSRKG